MPELPEVEALADHLRRNAVGLTVGRVDVAALSVLKTFDPPLYGADRPGGDRRPPLGQISGHAGRRPVPDHPSVAGRLAALVGQAGGRAAAARQGADRAARAPRHAAARLRGLRPHRGRHAEAAGGVAGRRPDGGAADRRARARRAGVDPRRARRGAAGQLGADQDRHHRSEGDRRHRQRLQRRDPARRQAVAVRDGEQADRCAAGGAARRDDLGAHRRGAAVGRPAGRHAEGGEALRAARARAHRVAVSGVRRHRARGVVRRQVVPVLPDLPDRAARCWPTGGCRSCSSSPGPLAGRAMPAVGPHLSNSVILPP